VSPGATVGSGMVTREIWHKGLRQKASSGTQEAPSRQRAYRWFLLWFCGSPIYVLFTSWKPVWITLISTALVVPLLPLVLLVLLRLNNDRRLLGKHANGWLVNAVLLGAAGAACWLAWRNAAEFWAKDVSRLFG